MEENQEREQYFFEEETMAWLGALISRTRRVAGVFTPSLLRFPNVWVFDADERWAGQERFTRIDVTRTAPDLRDFGMVVVDPPFALGARHLGRILAAARGRPMLISATDWCVACAGWGELFRAHQLAQVTAYFPRYRSIGNGYCEATLKRDGRTNISFFSNVPFAPPRRPAILRREGRWSVFDPYDFRQVSSGDALPPEGAADGPGADVVAAAQAKARELDERWDTLQRLARPRLAQRLRRLLGRAG